MLKVENLTKYYGDHAVVKDLNFKVEQGNIVGFLGPNGSGKTTTLNVIAGLLGQSSGRVNICGFDTLGSRKPCLARLGYLPDDPPLFPELRVKDFLKLQAQLRQLPRHKRVAAVQGVVNLCDLASVTEKFIGKLSKGFRQRVGLAAVLVHSPQVLILDEPTDGLDPEQIQSFREVLRTVAKKSAVLLSTHILAEAEAVCDEVLVIKKGQLVGEKISLLDSEAYEVFEFQFSAPDVCEVKALFGGYEVVSLHRDREKASLRVKIPRQNQDTAVADLNARLCSSGAMVFGIAPAGKVLEERFLNLVRGGVN